MDPLANTIEEGKKLSRNGCLKKARAVFSEILRKFPDNGEALFELAKLHYIENKISSAKKEFRKVLKINQKHIYALYMLGKIAKTEGDLNQAVTCFREAVQKGYSLFDIHKELAHLYCELKDYNKALSECRILLTSEPGDPELREKLGLIYEKRGQTGRAIKEYKNARQKGGNNLHIATALGSLYQAQGNLDAAIREFTGALKFDPSNKEVLLQLSHLYQTQRKFASSLKMLLQYTEAQKKCDYMDKTAEPARRKKSGESKRLRIKIIRIPFFASPSSRSKTELTHTIFLPLGMGQLVSYLRHRGIRIDQDDLNIRIHHDNAFGRPARKIDEAIFHQRDRILRYVNGRRDRAIDTALENSELKSKIRGYDVLLFSVPNEYENESAALFTLAFSKYVKTKYAPVVIIGGFRPSYYDLLKEAGDTIDIMVLGKGEKVLFKILEALRRSEDLRSISSIVFKDNKLVFDPGFVPFSQPDFGGLPIGKYRYRSISRNFEGEAGAGKILKEFEKSRILISPFSFMEGCPFRCAFCGTSTGKMSAVMNPKDAVSRLRAIRDSYDISGFFFLNNTLNVSKIYLNAVCDEFLKARFRTPWMDCARGENIDKRLLAKCREAGCIRLIFGMESASARMLKYVHKEIDLKYFENILKWADEAGIWVGIELICGFPYETDADVKFTADFINDNSGYIDTIYFNKFSLEENSLFYTERARYGIERIFRISDTDHLPPELDHVRHGYDETTGLKWADKVKRMQEHIRYYRNRASIETGFPFYELEHLLVFLYSRYGDKKEIKSVFNKIRQGHFVPKQRPGPEFTRFSCTRAARCR